MPTWNRIMACKLAVFGTAAVAALLMLGPAPLRAVLPLDVIGLPSPTDVVKLLDYLTTKDSSTNVEVKLGDTVSQGKLLVARTRIEVAMDRSSRNWRGPVEVHMTVPTDVSYSVNLAAIRPEHIRVDAQKRLLIVTMPDPEVEDVTPILTELKSEDKFKRARFRRLDGDASRHIQNAMLREDYQQRARKEGEVHLPQVRDRARTALQGLLQTLLRPNCPDVRVRVE
jgi:hypothetical protein